MKLAIVYDKNDYKLSPISYSKNYYDMFTSLIERFDEVHHITSSCRGSDIDADVIVFWDVHSCHDVTIEGIQQHSAVKYEYMNDPHQIDTVGQYINGPLVHKLGGEARAKRALERGIDFIICPAVGQYFIHIAPHLDSRANDMLIYWPVTPKKPTFELPKFNSRSPNVIASGSLWRGEGDFRPYEFRSWAYKQDCVKFLPHYVQQRVMPIREEYLKLLALFRAGLAMCDVYVVARYMELPLCGCVTIMQELEECHMIGFNHYENCVFVNKDNFRERVEDVKNNTNTFETVAYSGRKLIEENWCAERFADFIYEHSLQQKSV
jgi:hypothetical protein